MEVQPNLESSLKYENKEIDVIFTNENDKKEEKYKLLNEEKESLLIKEDFIKNNFGNYQIKISELFQNEGPGQYYINKEKAKEKYLKNIFELEKKTEDITFNNKDQNEMQELYRETSLKHPRKLVNGEIKKYPFCSWTGFFTCQKYEKLEKNQFIQLGFGISSYFKTIKLFIFFFLIISVINLHAVNHYIKYKSVINDDNFFFKTTLGNTKITTYNAINCHLDGDNYPTLDLKCYNKTIGKFVYGIETKDSHPNLYNQTEIIDNFITFEHLHNDILKEYYNRKMSECFEKNVCPLKIDKGIKQYISIIDRVLSSNHYLYYECIDKSLMPENTNKNQLFSITRVTSLFTFLLLCILYYYYKGATTIDNEFYHKDKITINNYTLVLKGLKRKSKDYFQELNDLIEHLNNIIIKEMQSNNLSFEQDLTNYNNDLTIYNEIVRIKNIYTFDACVSTVNATKMAIIENIKSLKDEITNLKEGNDTFEKKIQKKISDAIENVTSLYNQIKNKNKEEEEEENPVHPLVAPEEDINITNQKKIEKTKKKIEKQITKIKVETNKNKYADIYITFKNPLISNYIYQSYNKNFIRRILLFLCCKIKTIKLYYYKKQWLNFDLANNAPTNIKWENCYITTKEKWCRRFLSHFITIFIVIMSTLLIALFTKLQESMSGKVKSYIITGILKAISFLSTFLLEKLTKCEKYTNLTKDITIYLEKYFVLNFAVSTISLNIDTLFTYRNNDTQYPIIMSSILQSMMLSIVTEHLSPLAQFLFCLFKRYLDSDFENGKKTKLKKKVKYEELYIGPEFPIGERLSGIFVNLSLTLFYGTSCPLIYLFFTLYLLTTFIVDKILIIHYYKKPPYYDNYFTILYQKILFWSIFIYIYGTIYYISNPYFFNYYQNDSVNSGNNDLDLYSILNPFSIIYSISAKSFALSIVIFNRSDLSDIFVLSLFAFLLSLLLFKLYNICCKKKEEQKKGLHNSPNVDIALVYSLDELNKYYEVKKLELFKILLSYIKNPKELQKYSKLANNYKNLLDYLQQNINYKMSLYQKGKNNYVNKEEINTNTNNKNITDSGELTIKDKAEKNKDRLLLGDPSFNMTFIPNYEIFGYFDLLFDVD